MIIENPVNHIGQLCHVDGWPRGCVFRLHKIDGDFKVLVTPKTGKVYRVTNALRYTKRQIAKLYRDDKNEPANR